MRLYEFANAQEQLALWKLISDSVWNSISVQAQAQEQKRATDAKAVKKSPKSSPRKSSAKRAPPPTPPKPRTSPKKTDSKTDAEAKQKSASQTQKPQVLPNVFTSTARSNPAQPQTPLTRAASLSAQNAAKTRSERQQHDPNSVANIQRQLYPLAFDPAIKKLTN